MCREGHARRGSRYSGDEALREDSRTKPPGAFRTANGSETEHAPQARRRDATNSTRIANAARRAADSRAPDLRRGGLRRTRPRRQSQDCRAGRRTRKPPRIRAGSARLPPAVPHVVRHKDKGERQKLQTTLRRLQFANDLRNRLTHYSKGAPPESGAPPLTTQPILQLSSMRPRRERLRMRARWDFLRALTHGFSK